MALPILRTTGGLQNAAAVTAASQVAIRRWYGADPPVPLRPLIELALRQLATACSQPPGGQR
jgi:hypothetical protein